MKSFIFLLSLVSFLVFGGVRLYHSIKFNQKAGGNLKRAADANTIQIAEQELTTALTYLEREGLTEGYTSVLYNTPDEDITFWYNNLKTSLRELDSLSPDASQLEKSNMLIKLRETLIDHGGKSGDQVTVPDGISIYPYNLPFALWGWISFLLLVISGGYILNTEL